MHLTRAIHRVRAVSSGHATALVGGTLTVSEAEAAAIVAESAPAVASVRASWVSPGESARIVKVLDAVEPRTKGVGGGGIFPGFLKGADDAVAGAGTTHILSGVAVVVAGYLPRAQEALVDMSGPAAPLSPLASTHNLVIEFEPGPEAAWEDIDTGLRLGALRLAARLAETALDVEPDETLPPVDLLDVDLEGLPRIGVVTNLQTQGAFKDVFVRGASFVGAEPELIDADDLDDGAVVSGQFGHPSLKNPTYAHQNHPVVAALRARHGRDLAFAGVIISPEPVDSAGKDRVSKRVAEMCREAGFDGVIVTKEGGGNADADMSLKMDAAEDLGMCAVGLFAEMAGVDGTGPPVVVPPERATAMVSTGNYDQRLVLPAVERALGGDEISLLGVPATSEVELPAAVVYCSLSPLGWGHLTCAPEEVGAMA